ncbi:hypothetical protein JCM10914A_16930 [Paenibacillus sp. JCM 10914]
MKNPSAVPDLSKFSEVRTKYLHIFNDVMDQHHLDALVFPQMYKETPLLDSEDKIADTTVPEIHIAGVPLVTVPAGYYKSGSPFSIAFVGKDVERGRTARHGLRLRAGHEASRCPLCL